MTMRSYIEYRLTLPGGQITREAMTLSQCSEDGRDPVTRSDAQSYLDHQHGAGSCEITMMTVVDEEWSRGDWLPRDPLWNNPDYVMNHPATRTRSKPV